mgnify:CR=1 FL=1
MAEIDQQILQQYYDSRNYAAAAEYLKTATAKDYRSQQQLNAHIRQLERDAAIQKSIYNGLDDNQKEAYAFMQGLNGVGTIPRNRTITINGVKTKEVNRYGTNYLNYMSSLKSNDGTALDRIAIDINSEDDLSLLTSTLGLQNINSNDMGISYQPLVNGKHRIILSRDNKNLYKVLSAVENISSRSGWDIVNNIAEKTVLGTGMGAAGGAVVGGVGAGPGAVVGAGVGLGTAIGEEIVNSLIGSDRFNIYGVAPSGNVYSTDEFNYDNLEAAMEEVSKANDIYKDINLVKESQQTFTTKTVVTQFLGAGHAEAFKALQQGKIDPTTYDKIAQNWEDAYDRLISGADFTKHEVYAWSADSGKGINLTKVDNADVPDLKGEVLLAMKEGRVSKALCIKDGEIGTLLTIDPQKDKDGKWSKGKGDIQKQIFIQGLFEGTAEQAFEADTKSKAARQNADMKRWNYEQKLSTGVTVGYSEGSPYMKAPDAKGNMFISSISEEDMVRNLNENAILENSVLEVLANIDENGELPYQTINGRRVRPTIESMLNAYSIAATNELYPKGSTTERERIQYQNNMYNAMQALYNRYYNYQHN